MKYDNDSYVRDYSRCILCYKCVEACGEDAQSTFAMAVADRGFEYLVQATKPYEFPIRQDGAGLR